VDNFHDLRLKFRLILAQVDQNLLCIRLLGKKRLDFFFERHLHHSLRVDIGLTLRGDVSNQVEGRLSVLAFLLLDKLLRRCLVFEFEQEVFEDQV
jgi:hypothetical protein